MAYAGTPIYDDPVFYYYHSDHLGSSNIMTDADGDLVQHYPDISGFGRLFTTELTETTENNFIFTDKTTIRKPAFITTAQGMEPVLSDLS